MGHRAADGTSVAPQCVGGRDDLIQGVVLVLAGTRQHPRASDTRRIAKNFVFDSNKPLFHAA